MDSYSKANLLATTMNEKLKVTLLDELTGVQTVSSQRSGKRRKVVEQLEGFSSSGRTSFV